MGAAYLFDKKIDVEWVPRGSRVQMLKNVFTLLLIIDSN